MNKRKVHLIPWENLRKLLRQGGIGLHRFEPFNNALLVEQYWLIVSNPRSMVREVIIQKYDKENLENIN